MEFNFFNNKPEPEFNFLGMDHYAILAIVENPPNDVINKELARFNRCCDFNNYTHATFDDIKEVLIEYLRVRIPSGDDMDVKMVCESNWQDRAFSDTAPRDCIMGTLEDNQKIRKLLA